MRPPTGQEYINMARAIVSKLIIICFGLQLSLEESVSNSCGRLYYDKPAVAGRNITLKFEPVQAKGDLTVIWKTKATAWTVLWSTVSEEWNYHLDNFSLVINTTTDDQGRRFYTQYGSCSSVEITLKLKVVSNSCGRLSYDWPAVVGRNVTLKFEPVQADGDLTVIWKTKATTWTVLWSTVSEEWNYHLDNFSLVINTTTDDQGRRVYTQYGACSSVEITLKLKERPNIPELLNTQSIEDCHNCIVGNFNDSLDIRCHVTGGTAPFHVNITVGSKSTYVFSTNEGIYVANIQLTTTRHMANVTCSVSNIALDSPLMSEARLYILVTPLEPVFDVPEIVDDKPHIYTTCTSSGARPPSDVKLNSSDSEISNANRTTRTKASNTYNTSVTLLRMEKDWNLQNLTCCVNHRTYTSPRCRTKQLIYKFKPQSVRVSLVDNYTAILPYYTYGVTCTVRRAYPACSVTWVWPDGVDKLNSTESFYGTNVITTEAELSLNISRKINGKEVTCKAVCAEVDFNQADVHIIFVPYERTISFNVSSPIKLTESTTTVIECTANWATTVRWLDSENHTALLIVDCGIGVACLQLDDVSKKHSGNYTCLANDSRFNVSKQLTVTVEGLPDRHTSAKTDGKNSSTILVIIMTCIVLLLAAVVLVVVLKRRNSKKSEMVQNVSTVPAAGPSGSVVSYASVQESDTYSTPLPKSQRPKADNSKTVQDDDTYAMPLPKSQRNNANTANLKSADAPKELIYADLDLQPSSTCGSGAMAKLVIRKDGPETEYIDIDFNKKAAPLPDSEEEDNVYANQ